LPKEKREIKLFIAKDEKSAALVKLLNMVLETLPPKERPHVKLHVVKIDDVKKFPEFLAYLEEIYGGIHTLEFRRYGIAQLPAIVIDDQKVLEGEFPDEDQLRELLISAGVLLPPKIAVTSLQQQSQYPPVTPPRIQEIPQARQTPPSLPSLEKMRQEYSAPESQKTRSEFPQLKPAPKPETMPLQKTEISPAKSAGQVKSEVKTEKILKEGAEIQIKPEYGPALREPSLVKDRGVKERREALVQPSGTRQPTEDLRGTCFDCIFYDERRGRCLRMSMQVPDPYNPPCGRKRQ